MDLRSYQEKARTAVERDWGEGYSRGAIEMMDTESLVPAGHLLRQVDTAVDFERLYDIVEPLYSENEGRRSFDPVVLFMLALLREKPIGEITVSELCSMAGVGRTSFCPNFEENREFYALLNKRGLVYLLKDIILDLCGFNPEQELPAAYASAYVAFFLYGWIEVWFRRGMRDTAEELIAYLPRR